MSAKKPLSQEKGQPLLKELSSSNLTGALISPECSFKMCKKIAQLTKVVYYLNTKNEDHSTEVRSLTDIYEEEISDLLVDSNSKITDLVSKVNEKETELKAHEQVIQSYLESITTMEHALNDSKLYQDGANKRISELTLLLEEKEKIIENEINNKNNLQNENSKLRSSQTHLLSDLDSTRKRSMEDVFEKQVLMNEKSKQSVEQMNQMKKEYEDQIGNLTEANNSLIQKLTETERSFEEERTRLEEFIRLASQSFQKKNEDETKYFQSETKRLKGLLANIENQQQDTLKVIEAKYVGGIENMQKLISEQRGKLKYFEDEIASLNDVIEISRRATVERATEANQLRVMLSEFDAKYVDLEKQYFDKNSKLMRADMLCEQLDAKLAKKTSDYEELDEKFSQNDLNFNALSGDFNDLCIQYDAAVIKIKKYEEEITKLTDLKDSLEFDTTTLEIKIGELETQILVDAKESAEKLANSTETLRTNLTTHYEDLISNQTSILKNELETTIKEKDTEIYDLKETLELTNLETHLLTKNFNIDITKLKETLDFEIDVQKKEIQRQSQQNSKLEKINDEHERSFATLSAAFQNTKVELEQMELDRAHLYQKMVSIDQQLRTEFTAKFNQDLAVVHEEWRVKMEGKLVNLQKDMDVRNSEDMQCVMTKMHDEKIFEMNNLTNDFVSKIEKLTEEKKDIDEQLVFANLQLIEDAATILQIKAESEIKLKTQADALTTKAASEIKESENGFNNIITQLKVANAISLSNMEKKIVKMTEDQQIQKLKEFEEQKTANDRAILIVKAEYETSMKINAERFHLKLIFREKELEDLNKKAIEQKELEVIAKWEEILQNAKENFEGEIRKKLDIENGLKHKIDEHIGRIGDLMGNIDEQKEANYRVSCELAAKEVELDLAKKNGKQALKEQEKFLIDFNRQSVEQVNMENLNACQEMLKEFDQAQDFLKNQISGLEKDLEAAALHYINRESRTDDVEKIAALEREYQKAQSNEENQFYRLELSNREANFNKIFSNTPKTGIMPVLTKKKSQYSDMHLSSKIPVLPPLTLSNSPSPAAQI